MLLLMHDLQIASSIVQRSTILMMDDKASWALCDLPVHSDPKLAMFFNNFTHRIVSTV